LSGYQTRLDRQWFEANASWYFDQINTDLDGDIDIENTLAYFVASNRLIGYDLASLFAKFKKQEIDIEDFHQENAQIVHRLDEMKRQIESFNDDYYRVKEFPVERSQPLTADDIVNPYAPGGLFKDALWPLNFMWLDWYGIDMMQRYQTAALLEQPIPPELGQMSLEVCRVYEAIDRWPDAPNGAILGAHATLGMALVFLKRDDRHTMWARRKLAAVERLGYVFPPAFREKMAEMWGLSVEDWWLPNNEGNTPMLTEIRRVVKDRHEHEPMVEVELLANVQSLSAIFAKLDVRNQSAVLSSSTSESLSPLSDGSGTTNERGSNASISPTNASFGDTQNASFTGPGQSGTQKRRAKRTNSRS
jgi:hypothetical protein